MKLPAGRLAADLEDIELLPRIEGMVVGAFPGGALVRVEGGELICGIAKAFRPPEGAESATPLAVGDCVTVGLAQARHSSESTATDKDRRDGWILQRQRRRTALSRPQPRSGKRRDEHDTEIFEKVVVANMDVLLIVAATVEPPLRQALIDRFLIVAERGQLQPVLVINKIDLCSPDRGQLEQLTLLVPAVYCVSAATGARHG